MLNVYVGEDPSIEKRPARTSAGSSSNGLGREPRGPNQVLSSHNAVILAPATMELRVGTSFSASARKTILAKQRFGESTLHFMLKHGKSVVGGRP